MMISFSEDNKTYSEPILFAINGESYSGVILPIKINVDQKTGRFVKINVENYGMISNGLQGAGNKAWTFIDEIIVE